MVKVRMLSHYGEEQVKDICPHHTSIQHCTGGPR